MLVSQVLDIISDYFSKTKVGHFIYRPLKYLGKKKQQHG